MIWIIIAFSIALVGVTILNFRGMLKEIRLTRKLKALEPIIMPTMQSNIYKKELNIDTIHVDVELSSEFCKSCPEYEDAISDGILRQLPEGLKDYVVIHEIPDIQLTDLASVRVFRGELRVVRPEKNNDKQRKADFDGR